MMRETLSSRNCSVRSETRMTNGFETFLKITHIAKGVDGWLEIEQDRKYIRNHDEQRRK